jgi:hypothetical protein
MTSEAFAEGGAGGARGDADDSGADASFPAGQAEGAVSRLRDRREKMLERQSALRRVRRGVAALLGGGVGAGSGPARGLTALLVEALPDDAGELALVADATGLPATSLAALRAGELLDDHAWPDGVVELARGLGIPHEALSSLVASDLRAGAVAAGTPPAAVDGLVAERMELLRAAWDDAVAADPVP